MIKIQKNFQKIIIKGIGCLLMLLIVNGLLAHIYAEQQYQTSAFLIEQVLEKHPEDETMLMTQVKQLTEERTPEIQIDFLKRNGFDRADFSKIYQRMGTVSFILGMCMLAGLLFSIEINHKRDTRKRVALLSGYLEEAINGYATVLLPRKDDLFSVLEDTIYKTITALQTSKSEAEAARKNFAQSLENIAHQIKTPVTAILTLLQTTDERSSAKSLQAIKQQSRHICDLLNVLLTTSQIDAGVLALKNEEVDIYTMLTVAAETLEPYIAQRHCSVEISENIKITFMGDLNWNTEIMINLMKNSIEHNANRITFHCLKNPIYTEIKMCDNGEGFKEEELPHIFDRFYQGNHFKSGTGIGLSMARSIIEMQNGFIHAFNHPDGGAVFCIRFYHCH